MANLLSASRLVLALPFAWLVLRGDPYAAALFALAVFSDLIDGPIARRSGAASPLGRLLDHGADFAFVCAGLMAAASRGAVPLLLPVSIALAFAQYALDSHFLHREPGLRMSRLGRWNGVLYFVPLGGVCLGLLGVPGLESATRASAWLLVASTTLSIADRLLAVRRSRGSSAGGSAELLELPATLDQVLSPAWLSAALGRRFPGIAVTAVMPGPVISRVATNARFRIECAGGPPEGLSPDLCAKGYFTDAGQGSNQAGEIEARFYRDLAEKTGMRTLRSVFADFDPQTRRSLVITEDVVARGAVFTDARSHYTPEQAAQSLEELAKLHATTWNRAEHAAAPWLASRLRAYTLVRGIEDIRFNFEGPIGAGVPEKVRDARRLYDAYGALSSLAAAATPWCVIHGDPHVGNLFLERDGRPAFVDWQLVQRGPWYLDVGYHVASALGVAERREHEAALVRHYLDRLATAGIDAPAWQDAWLGIRRGMVHGFYLWGITRKVDPAITRILLERLGTAAADHDAFAAVGG